jgi:uncharacterized protein YegJ (DUF2314 family)
VFTFKELWGRFRGRRTPPEEESFVSVVLLLREARSLPKQVVELAAERAWSADFHTEGSGNLVAQNGALCFVKYGGEMFQVINSARGYGDTSERVSEEIMELRQRTAWADHRAWVSVDYITGSGVSTPEARLAKLSLAGRLAAELVNSNCTAILLPADNILIPYDESLPHRLRVFQKPEDLYSGGPTPVPVIDQEDPRLATIVAEARTRWQEFVGAFPNRTPDDRFLVKALFADGADGEWMWLEVESIQGEKLIGSLQSSPAQVRSVGRGDQVTVCASEIGDWYCSRSDGEHGGFSRILFE